MTQNRTPKGVPTGGEFAANAHDEARPLMPGYTYEQRSEYPGGEPVEHMEIGEVRDAAPHESPFELLDTRVDDDDITFVLHPKTAGTSWVSLEDRASNISAMPNIKATVERANNHRDWLRQKEHPLYLVTMTQDVYDPNTGETTAKSVTAEFVNPYGIPTKEDAMLALAENASAYEEEFSDLDDYVARSDREPEDAAVEHQEMQERAENLKDFLGDDLYRVITFGDSRRVHYETEEYR